MKVRSKWGSVRKVRSLAQIMALIEAVTMAGTKYRIGLRESLVEQHINLERARQRGAQTGYRPFEQIRSSLHALTEDNLSFLKRTSFVRELHEKLVLSADSRKMLAAWRKGDVTKARDVATKRMLLSPYKAYFSFIQNMEKIGGSYILRGRGQKRTRASRLRQKLNRSGFETDVASFFTIRDLFCDLRILNTVTDPKSRFETIFLTSRLTQASTKAPGFSRSLKVGRYRLHVDREITEEDFCKQLVDGYRTLSRTWARWVSLIALRDAVTIYLRIPDEYFNTMMEMVNRKGGCDGFKVDGSVGYRVWRKRYGSVRKSMNMPVTTGGKPIQYIAVTRSKT